MIQGNLTVEEALAQWENEGNSMLDQLEEQQGMSQQDALRRAAGEVTEMAE